MKQNLPMPAAQSPCEIAWCRQDHVTPGTGHRADVGMWDLGGTTVEVILRQNAGEGHAPTVRVLFGPDWAPAEILDIPVHASAKLGDVIRMHSITTYAEFGQALTRAAAILGREVGR